MQVECPVCRSREMVEVDLHSDGFAKEINECFKCGTIWTTSNNSITILTVVKSTKLGVQTSITHTEEEHTKFSNIEDELVAEDSKVWFG